MKNKNTNKLLNSKKTTTKTKKKTKQKKGKKGKKKNSNNGKIHYAKIWVNQFNYCSHTFIQIGDNSH